MMVRPRGPDRSAIRHAESRSGVGDMRTTHEPRLAREPNMPTPGQYNLAEFSLHDMTVCSSALRMLSAGATGMDDAAQRLVNYLYEHLVDGDTGEPACALVRL